MSRIRIAKEEDLETLMMLAKEFHIAFREGSLPRWEESVQDWGQWLSSCITLRDRVCLIAEEDGEPAGFLTAILLPAWYNLSFLTATETAVWVRRKFRRSGLAYTVAESSTLPFEREAFPGGRSPFRTGGSGCRHALLSATVYASLPKRTVSPLGF